MSKYQTVDKPLTWFRGNPENYRSHPASQQAVLQESLRRFGVFRNVVARPDGTILAGHGILAAAAAEGHETFPCVIFDGTDSEARALMVADNEQARLAEDDADQLSQLLASLQDDGLLTVSGHDEESLAQLLEEITPATPPSLIDFSAYGSDDQDGGGSAWGSVGSSDNVRLTWGEIEAALPRELYDRVYAVLMERYNAGSNFGSDLSKALTEFADGCENRGN